MSECVCESVYRQLQRYQSIFGEFGAKVALVTGQDCFSRTAALKRAWADGSCFDPLDQIARGVLEGVWRLERNAVIQARRGSGVKGCCI